MVEYSCVDVFILVKIQIFLFIQRLKLAASLRGPKSKADFHHYKTSRARHSLWKVVLWLGLSFYGAVMLYFSEENAHTLSHDYRQQYEKCPPFP